MLHKAHSGYTVMSEKVLQRKVDDKIEVVKESLSKEIQDDVRVHKSIALTSDGGTSGDQNKTKKNTLTCSRISEKWELKTDTIAVAKAVGSQTGPVIRAQWKQELCKIGYSPDWRILVTTDAAPNEQSARAPGRHDDVGLLVEYATDCVDHQVSQLKVFLHYRTIHVQVQLVLKDSLKRMVPLKQSLKRGRKLVAHFSKSTLSRQLLCDIQDEFNMPRKWILVGTQNRWFHAMSEAERLVDLRACIEEFQMRRQPGEGRRAGGESDDEETVSALTVPDKLDDEDFERLSSYVKCVKPFTSLSKFLGGEKYPTASSVIPALDQIL